MASEDFLLTQIDDQKQMTKKNAFSSRIVWQKKISFLNEVKRSLSQGGREEREKKC